MMRLLARPRLVRRATALAALGLSVFVSTTGIAAQSGEHDHHGTPAAVTCETAGTLPAVATPANGGGHEGHGGDAEPATAEFDQLYIDMMLPHHGSIIALAEVALPRLTDPRLQEMAQDIIDTQSAENEQLRAWRAAWYGSEEPATDEASMAAMLEAMPVGTMEEMMRQMDAQYQVTTFCAADNPDLAFIQQTIPHHQMAIDASEVALDQAVHPELVAFAEEVIAAQQAEIELLNQILAEYEASGTPVG